MTPFTIAKRMLLYIGVQSFDPAVNGAVAGKRAVEVGDIDFCADCMTGAAEEMAKEGPASLFENLYADYLHQPENVTLTVTQGSKTISGLTTYAAWQIGCSIAISGDETHNQLLSQTALLRPYMGASGSISAVIYGDAIMLPSYVKTVLDPVRLPTIAPLAGTTSRSDFLFYTDPHTYGNMPRPPSIFYTLTNKTTGQPSIWLAETFVDPATAATRKFLYFNPMPSQAYSVTLRIRRLAPVFSAADIYAGTAYTVDPGAIIPADCHASIFLPFAMMRFTAHPSFDNDKALREITRQYAKAREALDDYVPAIVRENVTYR